jgi:hypothetical protein
MRKEILMKPIFFSFIFLMISGNLLAQNYPELLVSPLATERVQREAVRESRDGWKNHLPVQISGIATLTAGILSQNSLNEDKDERGVGPKIAMVVGGAWVATTLWMQTSQRPYLMAASELKRMPTTNSREQLAAERLAEEHIDSYARLMKKMKWLSFGSNLVASVFALNSSVEDSQGKAASMVSVLASFAPLLFSHQAEQISEDQKSYKKKVFGPVGFNHGLMYEPYSKKVVPGIHLSLIF